MCSITSVLKSAWAPSPKGGAAGAGGIGINVFMSEIAQE